MSGLFLTLGTFLGLVLAWFAYGLLCAIRDALAERAAGWLLPSHQPPTFRLAQFVAFLAEAFAPSMIVSYRPPQGAALRFYPLVPVHCYPVEWTDPAAALAELQADLVAEKRALDPLRLTLPLLGIALRLRLRFLLQFALSLLWMPIGLAGCAISTALNDELTDAHVKALVEDFKENRKKSSRSSSVTR